MQRLLGAGACTLARLITTQKLKPMISLRSSLGASFRASVRVIAALGLVCAATLAQAQAYIGGSVSGQLAPGVYGRVDIGNAPPPPVMYAQPMLAVPPAVMVPQAQPQYLWVPPGHAKNWRKHCSRYHACGQRVYFLRNPPPHWHGHQGRPQPRYVAPRHEHRRDYRSPYEYRGERGHRHDYRGRDDRHGHGRDHGHDRGRGHGHGHGRHGD